MEILEKVNFIIAVIFFICYSYQFLYIPIALLKKEKPAEKEVKNHRFAVLICARNEEKVIGGLIKSIYAQSYSQSNIRIFVMADNCTDNTERIAKNLGAKVYCRQNPDKKGKGYALEELLCRIGEDYPNYFDGFFVFDADNVLDRRYIEEMNRCFCQGYKIITGYRNSKNYGSNWISAGYSLWFLRESRFLNHARFLLGNSCAVSGTGFFFSKEILEKCGGWPFHLLTEDIEFTVHNVIAGEKTGFCKKAVLYDEQPTKFSQSWNQRLRWAKGYLQVFAKYGKDLLCGILKGDFSCFDMAMAIMPAVVLSTFCAVINTLSSVFALAAGESVLPILLSVGESIMNVYLTLFLIGAITTVSEWKQIHTTAAKKIFYAFTFPLFMLTYIPISIAALFVKVEWKPIVHSVAVGTEEIINN